VWLQTAVSYTGKTVVTLPGGRFTGEGIVQYGDWDDGIIRVQVDEAEAFDETLRHVREILLECTPFVSNNLRAVTYTGEMNAPRRIELSDESGFLYADENITGVGIGEMNGCTSARYLPLQAVYSCRESGSPRYWMVPLQNYVAAIPRMDHGSHVLGFRTESVDVQSRQIAFTFRGLGGHIELLPDFEDRRVQLEQGRTARITTAVMVGELPSDFRMEQSRILEYVPLDYLFVLSVATGRDVGASWIELRDGGGALVGRLHTSMGAEPYTKSVFEPVTLGTGLLLTEAPDSPFWNDPQLRTIMGYMVRSGTAHIEDKFLHLARAAEGFWHLHGFRGEPLLNRLDSDLRPELQRTLKELAGQIQKRAKRVARDGRVKQFTILEQIASRVANHGGRGSTLGQVVADLCDRFGFSDPEVLEQHFSEKPRGSVRSWSALLSLYRNRVAHGSYFDLTANSDEMQFIFRFSVHLYDLLLRVLLKTLNYSGRYNAPVLGGSVSTPIDWITPSTTAANLGFYESSS
jgi:hypothetical protein